MKKKEYEIIQRLLNRHSWMKIIALGELLRNTYPCINYSIKIVVSHFTSRGFFFSALTLVPLLVEAISSFLFFPLITLFFPDLSNTEQEWRVSGMAP